MTTSSNWIQAISKLTYHLECAFNRAIRLLKEDVSRRASQRNQYPRQSRLRKLRPRSELSAEEVQCPDANNLHFSMLVLVICSIAKE